ncbi:MAG: glycine zipper 2TM domain-containing protein [Gammaproteobacteria bacterium]|nr:glycine zipper 2TM domain-containing protein [Gammaproteobacteria bacterium]
MNIKPWITTLSGAIVVSLALAATPAAADHNHGKYRSGKAVYDYARVLNVEPIVNYVTVSKPVRECWEETAYYTVEHRPAGVGAKTLFGAILGGVVGHQFGSGRGNDAATVAGTMIGAAIANDTARRTAIDNGHYYSSRHSRPVRRCETTYSSYEEERIDGYKVLYSYNGRKYLTETPYEPGSRLRIRVDVRPAP